MLEVGNDIPLYTTLADVEARLQYHRFLDIPLDQLGRIAAKYELPADRAAWANCGWDGCDEPHRFGFVITHKDGRETTCGQVCGARKGGVEFKEVLANLKRAEDANARRRVVVDLLANKTEIETELDVLLQNLIPRNRMLSRFRSHFQTHTTLWRELQKAARQGGTVRAAIKSSGWSASMGGKEQLETIARVQGYSSIDEDGGRFQKLLTIAVPWIGVTLNDATLGAMDDAALKSVVKERGRIADLTRQAEQHILDVDSLTSLSNVAQFEAIVDRILSGSARAPAREAINTWPKVFNS